MVKRPSRFTGIPALAQRWTVDAGMLRKFEIAAQPLSAPVAGCAVLRGFAFFAAIHRDSTPGVLTTEDTEDTEENTGDREQVTGRIS